MMVMVVNGYIQYVSDTVGNKAITKTEYERILSIIESAPKAPEGFIYKLRADDLELELVELPPVEPEPLTDEEALTRYANELTGADDPDLLSAAETMITKLARED